MHEIGSLTTLGMSFQYEEAGEAFTTASTGVWFLTCVRQNMGLQSGLAAEALTTVRTGVGLFPSVRSIMGF